MITKKIMEEKLSALPDKVIVSVEKDKNNSYRRNVAIVAEVNQTERYVLVTVGEITEDSDPSSRETAKFIQNVSEKMIFSAERGVFVLSEGKAVSYTVPQYGCTPDFLEDENYSDMVSAWSKIFSFHFTSYFRNLVIMLKKNNDSSSKRSASIKTTAAAQKLEDEEMWEYENSEAVKAATDSIKGVNGAIVMSFSKGEGTAAYICPECGHHDNEARISTKEYDSKTIHCSYCGQKIAIEGRSGASLVGYEYYAHGNDLVINYYEVSAHLAKEDSKIKMCKSCRKTEQIILKANGDIYCLRNKERTKRKDMLYKTIYSPCICLNDLIGENPIEVINSTWMKKYAAAAEAYWALEKRTNGPSNSPLFLSEVAVYPWLSQMVLQGNNAIVNESYQLERGYASTKGEILATNALGVTEKQLEMINKNQLNLSGIEFLKTCFEYDADSEYDDINWLYTTLNGSYYSSQNLFNGFGDVKLSLKEVRMYFESMHYSQCLSYDEGKRLWQSYISQLRHIGLTTQEMKRIITPPAIKKAYDIVSHNGTKEDRDVTFNLNLEEYTLPNGNKVIPIKNFDELKKASVILENSMIKYLKAIKQGFDVFGIYKDNVLLGTMERKGSKIICKAFAGKALPPEEFSVV